MNRLRRWCALLFLAALLFSPAPGQSPPAKEQKGEDKQGEKWLVDRALTVSPAAAPVPALKYRLFPSTAELKEGNAAPMYLRLFHERNDAWLKELKEKPRAWNKLPADKLPMDEVKKFLEGHKYNFKQLDLGARRKSADWHYAFDASDPVSLLLPDLHGMRELGLLLALKARAEIIEGRYPEAIRTVETGFSFSRQ